jgi:hypothetical protein
MNRPDAQYGRETPCWRRVAAAALLAFCLAMQAAAQDAPQPRFALPDPAQLDAKAVAVLEAMSATLAAADTLRFTAVASYESLARTGLPLTYTTLSEVTLQRPDKLRVITPADGPSEEFYYDGSTMMAFAPETGLVAVAEAPPTIDAMLQELYGLSATYFPFTDVIVADPIGDLAPDVRLALYIGQSQVVGGTTTDMVALADDTAQTQWWIGAEDHLPYRIVASFFDELGIFRHSVELSGWELDASIEPDAFVSAQAAGAKRIPFAPPGAP